MTRAGTIHLHHGRADFRLCRDYSIEAAGPKADAPYALVVHAIAAVCVAQAACKPITTWGIDDADSWKTADPAFHRTTGDPLPYPLMFDNAFAPKPSYTAMWSVLLGK